MEKLVKKIRINTTLELVTGLHVGGSKENVQIGGIDNPVIRTLRRIEENGQIIVENQPYIPGSSLKGKMRCLLEQMYRVTKVGGGEKNEDGKDIKFEDKSIECQQIINLFGFAHDKKPSKLIVRDAMLTVESAQRLRECEDLDMPYTEGKWENSIKRVEGTADNPRQTERIPAGVAFDVEFVINVWNDDKGEKELVKLLKKGMKAMENDYLGGSGSRGYGQIRFGDWKFFEASEESGWEMKPVDKLIEW